MKKLLKIGVAIAVAGLFANTASAVLLSTLIAGNGSISVGDKTFANFGFGMNSTVPGLGQTTGANNINVTVGTDGFGNYFVQFQGTISSGLGGHVDLALQYSVTASGGFTINAIDQAFNFGATGNGGTIIIAESANQTAFPPFGNEVAHSTVSFVLGSADPNDPPGELLQGDQLTVPNLTTVYVQKDIRLFAFDAGSIVDATIINQSFHQSGPGVPDGGSTLLLLGSAMSCLSFFGLRRKS